MSARVAHEHSRTIDERWGVNENPKSFLIVDMPLTLDKIQSHNFHPPRLQRARRGLATMMLFKGSLVLTVFLLSVLTKSSVSQTEDDYELRWASSGGGWRAMAANCGYTAAFAATGLITTEDSKFTAISTNSGGSW
jgi:hypothetical protein